MQKAEAADVKFKGNLMRRLKIEKRPSAPISVDTDPIKNPRRKVWATDQFHPTTRKRLKVG